VEHKLDALILERLQLRVRWNEAGERKKNLKNDLIRQGFTIEDVRHDKIYCKVKKEQKHLSKMIRHIEIKINRCLMNRRIIDKE